MYLHLIKRLVIPINLRINLALICHAICRRRYFLSFLFTMRPLLRAGGYERKTSPLKNLFEKFLILVLTFAPQDLYAHSNFCHLQVLP